MWVNKIDRNPEKRGYYKTLVDWDGEGQLVEVNNELYIGVDWCWYESNAQFISFWWESENN